MKLCIFNRFSANYFYLSKLLLSISTLCTFFFDSVYAAPISSSNPTLCTEYTPI